MSSSATPRAVIDADIIYSRVLHELLGRVAIEPKLLDIVWSEELLTEAQKVLIEKKGLASSCRCAESPETYPTPARREGRAGRLAPFPLRQKASSWGEFGESRPISGLFGRPRWPSKSVSVQLVGLWVVWPERLA